MRAVALLTTSLAIVPMAQAVDFEEHPNSYCGHDPDLDKEHNCGSLRSSPAPNPCWAYWSDSDTLDQCKEQCIKLRCPCLGYLATDTGYFHKCRIIAVDSYSGKLPRSSTGFVAFTTSGAFPLMTDPRESWMGWVVVCAALAYVLGGFAHGYVVRGKRRWEALPHVDQWRELLALAKDGAGFARSRLLSPKEARSDIRSPLRLTGTAVAGVTISDKRAKQKQKSSQRGADKKSKKSKKQGSPKPSTNVVTTAPKGSASSPVAGPDSTPDVHAGGGLIERREGAVHTSQQRVQVVSMLGVSNTS